MKDYQFFKASELKCKCGSCDGGEMNKIFMERLVALREMYDKPMIINSGYRCIAHNSKIGGEPGSMHILGRAVDISAWNPDAYRIIDLAIFFKFYGIGIKQKRDGRMIHLDDREANKKAIWTY